MTPLPTALFRTDTGSAGTFGRLYVSGRWFHSLELPGRHNARNVSCIPAGQYIAAPHHSPRFRETYHVRAVPGRTNILFHAGNWAGDVATGHRTDSQGCILLGQDRARLTMQEAITSSRGAIEEFLRVAAGRDLRLYIINLCELEDGS